MPLFKSFRMGKYKYKEQFLYELLLCTKMRILIVSFKELRFYEISFDWRSWFYWN